MAAADDKCVRQESLLLVLPQKTCISRVAVAMPDAPADICVCANLHDSESGESEATYYLLCILSFFKK